MSGFLGEEPTRARPRQSRVTVSAASHRKFPASCPAQVISENDDLSSGNLGCGIFYGRNANSLELISDRAISVGSMS